MKKFVLINDFSTTYFFQRKLSAEESIKKIRDIYFFSLSPSYRKPFLCDKKNLDYAINNNNVYKDEQIIVKGIRLDIDYMKQKEAAFVSYVNENLGPVSDFSSAAEFINADGRKLKRNDYQEALNLYYEAMLSSFKYTVDEENPNRFLIFHKTVLESDRELRLIYKRHKSTLSPNFMKKFDLWFEIFIDSLNDLVNKNIYDTYFYTNNTVGNNDWKPNQSEKNIYQCKFYEAFHSYYKEKREVCTILSLPDDIENSEESTKKFNKILEEKLIKSLSSMFKVEVDELTVSIHFPEGLEVYSRERFFKEIDNDVDFNADKLPHVVKAYKQALNNIK